MGTATYHEYVKLFPELSDEQIQELADDIAANGLRQPITVDEESRILDGRHRLAACTIAGVAPRFETFRGTDEEKLAFVVSTNLHRRHLTQSQRAMIAPKLEQAFKQAAMARKSAALKKGDKAPVPANLPEREKGDSRDKVGEALGVSGKSVDMATKVASKGVPELSAAVERGQVAVSAAAEVAEMPKEKQAEIVAAGPAAIRQAASESRAAKTVHVSQNSGNDEWYTPSDIVERARDAMGSIDLDPASNATANKVVKARKFIDIENDGLSKKWKGNVWLNPPYSRGLCSSFVNKLIDSVESQEVTQAICIVNNGTETEWGQMLLSHADAVCFRSGRVKFLNASLEPANTPLQGQMICYFGERFKQFREAFQTEGVVLS